MLDILSDYYRLPLDLLGSFAVANGSGESGFFRYGTQIICYGRYHFGVAADIASSERFDALKDVRLEGSTVHLPFSVTEVIDNLRLERYEKKLVPRREWLVAHELIQETYYFVRELLPVSVRRHLQRAYFSDWRKRPFPAWPVDFTVDTLHEECLKLLMEASGVRKIPFIWFWPDGAPNCLIVTHDVETSVGRDFTSALMDIDESYGIKGSFQVIPEKRYDIPDEYIQEIRGRGFEFNIHDLNHDGRLYRGREEFLRRAARINGYVRKYSSRGFRSGAMYRNLSWYDAFEFSYDMSVPNVAHLEPKRGGCCTVMPYFIGKILELPLTATQDYALFYILNDHSIDLWKKQIDLLRQRNGLMSFIIHPDYLTEPHRRKVFESLLAHLQQMIAREKIWAALPGDLDEWWRARSQMKLVLRGDDWEIQGPDRDRACVAYAVLKNGRLVYEIDGLPLRDRIDQ